MKLLIILFTLISCTDIPSEDAMWAKNKEFMNTWAGKSLCLELSKETSCYYNGEFHNAQCKEDYDTCVKDYK